MDSDWANYSRYDSQKIWCRITVFNFGNSQQQFTVTDGSVNNILPIKQNSLKNGYDENEGYGESYENKCATNYSIITSSSAPTPSVDPALPESAIGVPDQVMSEGWRSSSDAAQESPTAPDHSIHPIWTIETGQGTLCATQKQSGHISTGFRYRSGVCSEYSVCQCTTG